MADLAPGPEPHEDVEQAVEVARLLFESGVEMVFVASEGGRLFLSEGLPDRRVFRVARTLEQVRRYATEFRRSSA